MFHHPPPAPEPRRPLQASGTMYSKVLELLEKGSLPGDIRGHLVGEGYTLEDATAIVDKAIRLRTVHGGIALVFRKLYDWALEMLERGSQPEDLGKQLVAERWNARLADEIVQLAVQDRAYRYASQRIDIDDPLTLLKVGKRNMLGGIVLALGGLLVTVGSFAIAFNRGGIILIMAGLIGVGCTLFVRGMHQSANAHTANELAQARATGNPGSLPRRN